MRETEKQGVTITQTRSDKAVGVEGSMGSKRGTEVVDITKMKIWYQ